MSKGKTFLRFSKPPPFRCQPFKDSLALSMKTQSFYNILFFPKAFFTATEHSVLGYTGLKNALSPKVCEHIVCALASFSSIFFTTQNLEAFLIKQKQKEENIVKIISFLVIFYK